MLALGVFDFFLKLALRNFKQMCKLLELGIARVHFLGTGPNAWHGNA